MDLIDVAIVGGGPAGLTAASTIARQFHTAVVFDNKSYRNARASHMHMVPGWDHKDPKEFRDAARRDILAHYETIQFVDVGVATIEKKNDSHFKLTDVNGKEWNFRKVLLAVGSVEKFPDIAGFDELWGKKIYHCLFCHGLEDRGAPSAGVLANVPDDFPIPNMLAVDIFCGIAQHAAQLVTHEITIYTNGNAGLASSVSAFFEKATNKSTGPVFKVDSRTIKRLVEKPATGSAVVEFTDGSSKDEKFLATAALCRVQGNFVKQLGLATTMLGDIQAKEPYYQTSVKGVYAAGDCATLYKITPAAISMGCGAAVGVVTQLQAEKHGLGAHGFWDKVILPVQVVKLLWTIWTRGSQ
ncbi:putative thioredoxin reductase [Mycena sanguinolenta]|uniref:Putative thioredoxin reductase n=1 Tax=Mycena sanguinolenta TaxID=230812 RepID=A0A8H7DDD8_9AGAR|nr:putative thioredoxin reductase [Mycena sanguinolenta]